MLTVLKSSLVEVLFLMVLHVCPQVKECNPLYDKYCQHHYGNGHCDEGCNTAECNWDGMDCVNQEPEYATGYLIFIIDMPLERFYEMAPAFLRDMGTLMRTILTIAKDADGNDMVYPFSDGSDRVKRSTSDWTDGIVSYLRGKRAAADK